MTISARTHYAALAMIELARHQDRKSPVSTGEITACHGIPGPFLVQILRALRAAGWVQSIRGSNGGYRIVVDSATVTLLDIAEAVGCQETGCQTESKPTPADQALHNVWDNASEASRNILAQTKLIDLVEQTRNDAMMFYI